MAVQLRSDLTKVAIPCCLLRMEPARWNPGNLRVCFSTVRLLKEDGRDFMGVGEVAYDVQFGGGEALDI